MSANKQSPLILFILAASLLGACSKVEPSANAIKPPAVRVQLSRVDLSTLVESSEFVASLESRRSVTLQPQISGRVSKIFVRYGEQVPAGAPLIQIYPAEQQAAVNSYKAAAQAAQAHLQQTKATLSSLQAQRISNVANFQYNQKQYERYATLYAEGAVSQQQRDQYLNSLNAARSSLKAIDEQIQAQKATVAQAEKSLQQAQSNTNQQQVQLHYYKISAPFAGRVGNIPVKLGDYVTPSTSLTSITQNQPLEVNISIPIEDAPKLHLGTSVNLINPQGKTIGTSHVFFISPKTNNNTQSILVKSLFDNSKNQLKANQYIRAKVIWDKRPGILIPTTAVTPIGGQDFVYVAQEMQEQSKQGKSQLVAEQKPVKLGAIQGNDYQVLQGLQPGEQIVVSGIIKLSNGTPIIPIKS
ncbi:MAG: efflux RND transporter periplasmic adaptor subunit [Chroococcidiopsidaceae cyanobacterium CP_BM_ER_R8_30]|nr:efflux RND transporter periplasmic adaptor subunit [Chroococcidiopsidaceae cyanobacterium CP_BM_ER_R8_30]